MSKHTPGPWSPSDKFGGTVWAGEQCLAQVSSHDGSWDTSTANTHLMAAAPEMLQALKETVATFESGGFYGRIALSAMRAVIAKAEGQP